jgi:hypothetical protein
MAQTNARNTQRAGARGKRAKTNRRNSTGTEIPKVRRNGGVAADMLDMQRNLWKAGLSVLSRGSQLAASSSGATKITESLQGGLKKLEEVFDQRVLDALARASMPSPREMRELLQRVAELDEMVRRLARRRGKK